MSMNYTQRQGSQDPSTPVDGNPYGAASSNPYGTPLYAYHSTPPQSSYTPLATVEEDHPSQSQQPQPVPFQASALTSGLQSSSDSFGQPLDHSENADTATSQNTGYDPPTGSTGYEPPSYQPDVGTASDDAEDSQEEKPKPKKKSFMDDDDDDDDLAARAAALQKAEKERRDREVDEAVRRAAEADGKYIREVQCSRRIKC